MTDAAFPPLGTAKTVREALAPFGPIVPCVGGVTPMLRRLQAADETWPLGGPGLVTAEEKLAPCFIVFGLELTVGAGDDAALHGATHASIDAATMATDERNIPGYSLVPAR